MDSWTFLVVISAAFLLAGFVKGMLGLGLPTVAIGLLGVVMTPGQAAAIIVVPSLVTNVWQLIAGGQVLALTKRLWPMLTGICIGTAIGALLLPSGGGDEATVWLGVALMVYAVLGLCKVQFSAPPHFEPWLGLLIGTTTGIVSVATGVFAIPGVPYVQAMKFERDKLVQALGVSFTVSTVALAAALSHEGLLHLSLMAPSTVALAVALGGMWVGQTVRSKVAPATFRLFFLIGLFALGAHLALHDLI